MKFKLPAIIVFVAGFISFSLNAQQLKVKKKKGKASAIIDGENATGPAIDHLADGMWVTYYPTSEGKHLVHFKIQYKAGYRNGALTEYFTDGRVKVSGHYSNGHKMGHWQENFSMGNIHFTSSWLNDTIHGEQMTFYLNGKRQKREVYDRGVLTAIEEWSSSNIITRADYYENGKRNGRCYWNTNGVDSTYTNFCDYHYGQRNGEEHLVSNDGTITIIFYGLDIMNGSYIKTHHDGSLIESGMYDNGRKIGLWIKVFPNKERELIYYGAPPRPKGDTRIVTELPPMIGYDSCVDLYANGKVKMIQRAANRPSEFYSVSTYDTAGIRTATGFFRGGVKDSLWTTYYPNRKVSSTLSYDANGPRGVYKAYYPNGKLMFKVPLSKGRVYDLLTFYDDKGKTQPINTKESDDVLRPWFWPATDVHWEKFDHQQVNANVSDDEPRAFAEVMPVYPGGQEEMARFLQKNIKYPQMAKENGIQGRVMISFVVEKDGSVTNIALKKGVNAELDKEALRVVNMMPHWTPGMINDQPVRVQLVLPVNFKLN